MASEGPLRLKVPAGPSRQRDEGVGPSGGESGLESRVESRRCHVSHHFLSIPKINTDFRMMQPFMKHTQTLPRARVAPSATTGGACRCTGA